MTTLTLLVALAAPLASLSASPSASLSSLEVGHAPGPRDRGAASDLPGQLAPSQLAGLRDALVLDEPGDGNTWARGPKWKASMGPGGLTYIPFFGSDAPKNYPVGLDLTAVTVAGESLALDGRQRSRVAEVVTLDRGSLDEVYLLSKDSVEQTFVFQTLPGRGELVLDIAVKTELAVEVLGRGFRFFNHLGEVQYGAATVIDADGKSLAIEQQLTDSGFQIIVPEGFVESATLPLTVDPILSTFAVTNDDRRQLDVDVAYEGNNGVYQIVYSELQSATDVDVLAANYSARLDTLFPAQSIDTTSASWNMPSNASCYDEQQFLCVAIVGNSIGSRRVNGRTIHAGTGFSGPQFLISGFGAEHVDVGGKGNNIISNFDYMVVWQETDSINNDFDIVAQTVRGDSTLPSGRIVIDGDVSDLDRYPSISKSSGYPGFGNGLQQYMIVWEREISPTDRNIRAQLIDYTGNMTGHSQFNAYTFSDSRRPDVSSSGRSDGYGTENYWMIAFERRVGSAYKIFTVMARDGLADNARNIHTMQNLDMDSDHRDPHIAYDFEDYFLTYQTVESNGDYTAYMTALNVAHDDGELRTGLTLRRERLGVSEGQPGSLASASHWAGGSSNTAAEPGDAVVLWTAETPSTGIVNVQGAVVEHVAVPATGYQYCEAATNSTGASAWMAIRGFGWETNLASRLECSEMPPNSFGHFIVSNQMGFTANPGGSQGNLCLAGHIGRFIGPGQIKNSGSTGSFTLTSVIGNNLPSPTGPVSALAGETWYFQCWFRDVGPSSNFSNAVGITYD